MSDSPQVLTGKRKRATINYAELNNVDDIDIANDSQDVKSAGEPADGLALDDSDHDGTFGARHKKPKPKKKKKLKWTSASKLKKASCFRFLNLPPELRDMIYELALTDTNGVSIIAHRANHRNTARRGSVYALDAYRRTYWGGSGRKVLKDNEQKEISPIETKFIPAILALNKQVNAEAINYLYGHDFVFEDPTAMHSFLAMIGLRNQQRLAHIRIMAWGKRGVAKGNNHASLTLLAGATNLKSLSISCDVRYWSNRPQWIARRIFRDGHWFFEAYGVANGRRDAVVDILQMSDENFEGWGWRNDNVDVSTKQQRFKQELRSLLGVYALTRKSSK